MKRRRVANCGQPEETCLTLLPQPLERRHDVLEDLSDAEGFPATGFGDCVVQMEDVNPIAAQPSQAAFKGSGYGIGTTSKLRARQPDLCIGSAMSYDADVARA